MGKQLVGLLASTVLGIGLIHGTVSAQSVGPFEVPNGNFENWQAIGDGGVTNAGWASIPGGFTPATNVGRNDEMWSNPGNFGSGWQENLKQRTDGKYGLQHPSNGHHVKNETMEPFTLAAPFNGNFIGFANLTDGDGVGESVSQIQSAIVGNILPGTYTLTVAFGSRRGTGWNDYSGTISMVADPLDDAGLGTSGGTILGTPASVTMIPSIVPGGSPTSASLTDLTYNLTVNAGDPNIGKPFAIRIDTANLGTANGVPNSLSTFTQANFDNVRLTGPGGGIPTVLTLQVDPVTGVTSFKNTTAGPVTISGYRITSESGAINVAGWNPISNGNEFPAEFPPDNGTSDGLDWEVGPNPSNSELVEWYLSGESTLQVNESLNLGSLFNPAGEQDLVFEYTLGSNDVRIGLIEYVSSPGQPGDYNNNGVVDAADYTVWRDNLGSANALPNDDSPGVQQDDYTRWKTDFGNGAGSGAALGAGAVPEPSSVALLMLAAVAAVRLSRKRRG